MDCWDIWPVGLLGAGDSERGGVSGLVCYLDKEYSPPLLDKFRASAAASRAHSALGIDVHIQENVPVQDFLNTLNCGRLVSLRKGKVKRRGIGRIQGIADRIEG